MKTFACQLGMTSVLCSLAILASAAESKQTVPTRAAAPPDAAIDAPSTTVEHSDMNIVFQAVQLNAVADEAQAEQGNSTENQLVLATGDQARQHFQHMKERFADPDQREALRAEQRASVQQQYSEAGRVLGLDPATQHKLIEALTDQQMSQLERVYGGPNRKFDSHQEAQERTKHLDVLRELLGEEGLDRFQDYTMTFGERRQVGLLAARLGAGNELRPDQETRLIALLREQTVREMEAPPDTGRPMMLPSIEGRAMPSREEMQRHSQLSTIALNEEIWRRKQVTNRELQQQAAAFLAPAQLAELSKLQAQAQADLQRWIEGARAQVGMDPKIPEHAQAVVSKDARKPFDGQVQVEIRLTVNRGEPKIVTQTVRNGESFTFEAADGLIAEATPTLYDDDWLQLKMAYYEQRAAGKRLLQGGGGFGVRTRMPDGTPSRGGGGDIVVGGRKGYAIETMITATAL
jgi:hypothetical protein